MAMAPITGMPPVAAPAHIASPHVADSKGDPFSQLFTKAIHDANAQQLDSQQTMRQFAAGETDNVHDLVLSVAKADLSFRMILEIRNRLIDSYQEVMRMQF